MESTSKRNMKDLLFGLADAIYEAILPVFGDRNYRRVSGYSAAGDAQFDIDQLAERATRKYAETYGCSVALFTEDNGLIVIGDNPEYVLIIDPIDGTRSAAAGLESCCISIAAARYQFTPRIKDVEFAILKDLKTGAYIYGDRDHDELIYAGFSSRLPNLSTVTDLKHMFWSIEFNGHPADLMVAAYGHLIDQSANPGGIFIFSSSCYSISRIITGQLDAYVDIGNRLLKDHPALLPRFLDAGHGHILHLFPYDIAAVVFLAQKAGVIITDAYGNSLGETELFNNLPENQQSCIAASTQTLHEKLLESINWLLTS